MEADRSFNQTGDVGATTPDRRTNRREIAVYLANSLVPRDPDIRLGAQDRDYTQSRYGLEYQQAGVGLTLPLMAWSSGHVWWIVAVALLAIAQLVSWGHRRRLLSAERARP